MINQNRNGVRKNIVSDSQPISQHLNLGRNSSPNIAPVLNSTNFNGSMNSFPRFPNVNSTQVEVPVNVSNSSNSGRESTLLAKLQQLPRWHCRFSGTVVDSKNQSLNDYMVSIQNFMQTVELSSRDMMRHIYPTLRDGAQRFFLTLPIDDVTLEEFFDKLRDRFGDKRGATPSILELSKIRFDERRSIEEHIDEMVFKMQMLPYKWSETEQLAIIRQTLPDSYLKPIVYRGVTTINGLKELNMNPRFHSTRIDSDSRPRKYSEEKPKSDKTVI